MTYNGCIDVALALALGRTHRVYPSKTFQKLLTSVSFTKFTLLAWLVSGTHGFHVLLYFYICVDLSYFFIIIALLLAFIISQIRRQFHGFCRFSAPWMDVQAPS